MGALGGIVFTAGTGYLVSHFSYTPVWIASGLTSPMGLLILYLLLRSDSNSRLRTRAPEIVLPSPQRQ